MTLNEFKFTESNHFIAMEFYALVLNRTFLIVLHQGNMTGLKVNGQISAEGGGDPITMAITNSMSVKGDLGNPNNYIKSKYLKKLAGHDILGTDVLKVSSGNFRIPLSHIIETRHNPKKKWGMGPYPHDGRVFVTTRDLKKREFIILGNQSGQKIAELIRTFTLNN